ncbi:unnamed protein product [Ambrosiozyma monospora]|uniref:Unnamed protein product n=1 Tax=Ambrosiozyma monospora TaxID=43982 RepID=A0A9W6W881_AMBMO|nr:unnamed protein product [Ambrosiozyma monospora]
MTFSELVNHLQSYIPEQHNLSPFLTSTARSTAASATTETDSMIWLLFGNFCTTIHDLFFLLQLNFPFSKQDFVYFCLQARFYLCAIALALVLHRFYDYVFHFGVVQPLHTIIIEEKSPFMMLKLIGAEVGCNKY